MVKKERGDEGKWCRREVMIKRGCGKGSEEGKW